MIDSIHLAGNGGPICYIYTHRYTYMYCMFPNNIWKQLGDDCLWKNKKNNLNRIFRFWLRFWNKQIRRYASCYSHTHSRTNTHIGWSSITCKSGLEAIPYEKIGKLKRIQFLDFYSILEIIKFENSSSDVFLSRETRISKFDFFVYFYSSHRGWKAQEKSTFKFQNVIIL